MARPRTLRQVVEDSSRRQQWHLLLGLSSQFRRSRLAGLGAVIVLMVMLNGLFAPWLVPHDPLAQDLYGTLQAPSLTHLFGTDDLGRDVLSRLIFGARVSLAVGIIAVSAAVVVGVPLGLVAAYWGGAVDAIVMRVVDGILSFPAIILALAITGAIGASLTNVVIAIAVVSTPYFARLVRGQALSVKEREFIQAARIIGAADLRIIVRHLWPNVTDPVIVQSTLTLGFAILTEAALSFLGLGVDPSTPSWGSMMRGGYGYIEVAPWLAIAPGAAIFLTVFAFNVVGDGLRDALDPRLSRLMGAERP